MQNNIIVYGLISGCPLCENLKRQLKAKNISYTYNTNKNEMHELGITKVPAMQINNEILNYPKALRWVQEQ